MKTIPFKFKLGEVLKDIITKIEGVVMARSQYFTGCNHYGICPQKVNDEGKEPDWQWFDESRLVRTKKKKVELVREKESSGVFPNPPQQ